MKLLDFYRKAIQTAIDNDPRGIDEVNRQLQQKKKEYEKLDDKEKEFFDLESLSNPYSDSRIIYGSGDEEIKTLMVGIDIDTAEIVLAELLRQRGTSIDAILSHHPSARPFASLYAVMGMQAEILSVAGVPINVAESLTETRAKEVERKIMPANHTRAYDTAKLLNIPLMSMHTAGDNMVTTYLKNLFDAKKPVTLSDILDILLEIPEYKEASKINNGPKILIGNKNRKAGKIFVDMTGGTEGSKDIYEIIKSSGINTIVGMHISEEHRKEAEKHHINVVIAGHISSDNLGMNLLIDEVTKGHDINIVECSGFRRVKR
ncbi:MAG: NGG1p interacting factor NIF3 [Thermodesulfovibrionales bacterium]|nr:NGG1p interacting factor NIF3 [Thermodesulfovibrionales bacterium]